MANRPSSERIKMVISFCEKTTLPRILKDIQEKKLEWPKNELTNQK